MQASIAIGRDRTLASEACTFSPDYPQEQTSSAAFRYFLTAPNSDIS
jgi:hypothetical protein